MDSTESAINPVMVVLARESRGLSQSELAQRLSVTPAALSRVESGLRPCSDSMLKRLSDALEYPEGFFRQTDPVFGFGVSELFHRKFHDVTINTLEMIHAQINIRRIHLVRMLRGVEIGKVNIHPIDLEDFSGNPGDVARTVRATWRLPHGPVQNLTKAIEDARVIIIPFDFGTQRIDAISQWPPGMPPLIFVNVHSPGDRLRFTICHELGHLVMHQESLDSLIEYQANGFAAEFLMPERDIRPYLENLSLPMLASLKAVWKVSMAALLKRATDLGAITQRHARTLWTMMGKAGYRTREPAELDIPAETPTFYQEIIDVHRYEMNYGAADLAKMLNLSERDVWHVYLGVPRHLRPVESFSAGLGGLPR